MIILCLNTVIPRLTKIIRSEITFVSRNTHTDGKDKLLELARPFMFAALC